MEMALEAVVCRKSGNYWGYSQVLVELEAMGITSSQIRKILAKAEVLARAEDRRNGDPRENR